MNDKNLIPIDEEDEEITEPDLKIDPNKKWEIVLEKIKIRKSGQIKKVILE